jgi:glycosyltransferase involved in cell wall biosynthesis
LNLDYKGNQNFLKKSYKKFSGMPKLYREIIAFGPDLIICQSEFDNVRLNLLTIFNKIPIRVFVFGQMFQFKSDISKFSFIFKKKLKSIIKNQPDYKRRIGLKPSFMRSPITFVTNEIISFLKYWSLRRSDKVFVLSKQVKWEVKKLYGKEASILRGAIHKKDINYFEILNSRSLEKEPTLLSCCRLDEKKRVDVIINAFIASDLEAKLLIIGDGPEMNKLKKIANSSFKSKSIEFLGRVSDEQKNIKLAMCDVFISMDNSDFVISGIEAIARGKRAILSNHFDINSFTHKIDGIKLITPSVECLTDELNNIFAIESPTESNIKALDEITWEYVSNKILD